MKSITGTSDTDSYASCCHGNIRSDNAEKEQRPLQNTVGADGRG